MLRVHLVQGWFGCSDRATEEALCKATILRKFSGLALEQVQVETDIMSFDRLLEKHWLVIRIFDVIIGYLGDERLPLRQRAIVDAILVHAPSYTKKDRRRDHKRY